MFVESGTEMGGAQTALLALLQNMNRSRIEPLFVSLGFGNGDLPQRVRQAGIQTFELAKSRYRHLVRTAQKCGAIVKLIRENQIDAVFSNGGHPNLIARPAARLAQVPSVWWAHGYDSNDVLKGHPLALAQTWIAADVILANSHWTAHHLARHFPGVKLRVISPGVDLARFRPDPCAGLGQRETLGIAATDSVVGIFGRLQPWKGQHVFLEAASLLTRGGHDCQFLVVGGSLFGLDQTYAEHLKTLASDLSIEHRVHFLGHREDLPSLMNACDVIVHASTEPEPWGQVVAEAMACGKAVVASAAGGPLEMIKNGASGFLVAPGNSSELTKAIDTLLCDATLRARIGHFARQHAQQNLSAALSADQVASVFQQIANGIGRSTGSQNSGASHQTS